MPAYSGGRPRMRQGKDDADHRHDDAQAFADQRHEQVIQLAAGFGGPDRQLRLQHMREPEEQPEQDRKHAQVEHLVEQFADDVQPFVRIAFHQQRRGGKINAINPDQDVKRLAERAEDVMLQSSCLPAAAAAFFSFVPHIGNGHQIQEQHQQHEAKHHAQVRPGDRTKNGVVRAGAEKVLQPMAQQRGQARWKIRLKSLCRTGLNSSFRFKFVLVLVFVAIVRARIRGPGLHGQRRLEFFPGFSLNSCSIRRTVAGPLK